jgi:hypothetical protein
VVTPKPRPYSQLFNVDERRVVELGIDAIGTRLL